MSLRFSLPLSPPHRIETGAAKRVSPKGRTWLPSWRTRPRLILFPKSPASFLSPRKSCPVTVMAAFTLWIVFCRHKEALVVERQVGAGSRERELPDKGTLPRLSGSDDKDDRCVGEGRVKSAYRKTGVDRGCRRRHGVVQSGSKLFLYFNIMFLKCQR